MLGRLLDLATSTLAEQPVHPHALGIDGAVGDALLACTLRRMGVAIDDQWWVARAVEDLNAHGGPPSLHRGSAGVGFLLTSYIGEHESLCELDEILQTQLRGLPPASIQSGVAGIALYASLRADAGAGAELQHAVMSALAAAAVPDDGGVLWHTPPAYAVLRGVAVLGEPVIEFGMVHGIAGLLVALAALAAGGRSDAASLARACIGALWARMHATSNRFGRIEFGRRAEAGACELDNRWCVGDTGVLRAIWLAARVVGDAASSELAASFLCADASAFLNDRSALAPLRFDLCCGRGAIAQVYGRMYRETGNTVFHDAAEKLLAECLRSVAQVEDPSFAYGRAGVMLALLAPFDDDGGAWDSVLGMSLPSVLRPPKNQRPAIRRDVP